MTPIISTMYETQSQFAQVEEGHLNKSLLYECANFPGNLFTVMTSHMGVVGGLNAPEMSSLKTSSFPRIVYRPCELCNNEGSIKHHLASLT